MTQGEIDNIKKSRCFQSFEASGDKERVELFLHHGYLLTSMGIFMIEEANDLFAKHGLFHHGIKYTANTFSRAFDQHSRIMQSFMPGLPNRMVFLEHCDKIRPAINSIANIIDAILSSKEEIEIEVESRQTQQQ